MTRYARVGSSQKHQRPPGDATPWEELSGNSKKPSSMKNGKFNRIQKGRIEKNKGKGNKVGNKSFKLPTLQPTKSNIAENSEKQVSKEKSFKPNRSSTEGKLTSPGRRNEKKKSPKKRKKKQKGFSTKTDSNNDFSSQMNVTLDADKAVGTKKVKDAQKAIDSKSAKKVLTKNQQKKARKKKKLEQLKAKELGQILNGNFKKSAEKNSESSHDKVFLNKKNLVLEKLERKKSISTPLPSKVERKIFYIKKKLREKGLSQSAIREIVNKERKHEEEKFLKTCITKPCFNCRQIGHLLSNCPLRTDNSGKGTAACYKCGSSEHVSSQCSKKIQGFPLAKCFVCKEQGHISKDCPKNKHGLYVKGGGCAKCGNVNHLHKDCPSVKKRKEEEGGFVLHTINEGTSVDEEILEAAPPKFKKKLNKPKVVKF